MEEYKTKITELVNAGEDDNMIGEYIYYLYTTGRITRDEYGELANLF